MNRRGFFGALSALLFGCLLGLRSKPKPKYMFPPGCKIWVDYRNSPWAMVWDDIDTKTTMMQALSFGPCQVIVDMGK